MRTHLFLIGAFVIVAVSGAVGQPPGSPERDIEAPYRRVLDRSRQSQEAGDLGAALSQLETMLRVGGDAVPLPVRAEAVERIVSLEAAMQASAGSMRQGAARYLATLLTTKTFWMIVSLAMLALWRLYAHRHPRTDATAAFFEDLTCPLQGRTEASLVLTRTLLNQLQNPMPVRVETLEMDMMPGSEEPGFGGLQSALNTSPVDGFELADAPMKVGGIEFTVRGLAGAVSGLFSRPHAGNLTGWLSESEQGLVAYAELIDRADPERNRSWRVHVPGKGGRAEAINDLSAQILVDTGNSKLTHSWMSLRVFRKAIGLRQSAGHRGPADLVLARNYLEQAITFDASNWIARFNLALTLCRCGEPEIALEHFDILDEVIRLAWASNQNPSAPCSNTPAFQDVKDHLRSYPECAFLILYNKAMALAALHKPEATGTALRELRRLSDLRLGPDATEYEDPHRSLAMALTPRARIELSLYALGAEANVLATATHLRRDRDGLGADSADRIAAVLQAIESLCAATQERHWRSLQTARAVGFAAAARVAALRGQVPVARERLEASIAAEPRFVEAYLSLAELHIDFTTTCDKDWQRRAEMLLTRALELSPDCGRAMSLLARLPALVPRSATVRPAAT